MTLHLKERERRILHSALLNGDLTAEAIGENLDIPAYQIRRSLTSIQENGFATPYTLINQFSLGWMKIGVYFSFLGSSTDQIHEITKRLLGYENIVSLISLFGPYQYFMSINAKTLLDYEEFMSKLCADIPELKIDETISIRHSLTLFKRKYLSPETKDTSSLTYIMTGEQADLDDLSTKIINHLTKSGGFPNVPEMVKEFGVSNSTLHKKLKDLQDQNVIVGYSYNVDPYRLGMYPYDLLIKTNSRDPKFKKKFFAYCQKHLSVVGLTECIGSWQYEVRIEVLSPSEATLLSQEIFSLFKDSIQKIEIVSVCEEIKYMRTPKLRANMK